MNGLVPATSLPHVHAEMILSHVFNAYRFSPERDRNRSGSGFVFGIASMLLRDDAQLHADDIADKLSMDGGQIDELVRNASVQLEKRAHERDRVLMIRDRVYEKLEKMGAHTILLQLGVPFPTREITKESTMPDIARGLAEVFRLPRNRLMEPGRASRISESRFVAFAICKALRPTRSLPEIGRKFNGMDHTTVLHGLYRVNRALADPTHEKNRKLYCRIMLACDRLSIEPKSLEYKGSAR